jgi:PadR family transcriptional regulator AphA
MDRSLGRIWPRAKSKLYEEPKKLVAHGYAVGRQDRVGDRPRTVYSITAKGRRALVAWHQQPAQGPQLESEQLLRVFFAEHGSRADALATLAEARDWAQTQNEGNLEAARSYLAGDAPFQARAAQTMLVGKFLTEFYRLVAEWSEWATDIVEGWPDDPALARPDLAALEEIVRQASWSESAVR